MSHPVNKTCYDYIISGAGAAGLSLLARMITSAKFSEKKILLIDRAPKTLNDRTWCFWEKEQGFFESIVYRSWPLLLFHGPDFSKLFNITPYHYKMIRGIDFYNYCFELIASQKNITVQYGEVQEMNSNGDETSILLNDEKYTADYIFNSILLKKPVRGKKEFFLLQHFKGWIIESNDLALNEQQATLMDFRVNQNKGTAFVYVMPFSTNKALVEFTMFSKQLLDRSDYDENLRDYINNQLHCDDFSIQEEEFGVIPMTNYKFPSHDHNIVNIGTAGGQTKASTGYTFMSIQKKTASIVEDLLRNNNPTKQKKPPGKFHFYDSVLLNVLATGKLAGDDIFTRLFKKNDPHLIFQFLDNESSLLQDLKLIGSLPTLPFLKAGLQELF